MTMIGIIKPVVISYPARGEVWLRVMAPLHGDNLPVVIFSHGFQLSGDDYAPLVEHWAANCFVVIQPDHPDSSTFALPLDNPLMAATWRYRVEDVRAVIDQLAEIERAVPGIAGRIDPRRIVVAGHSFGGHTVQALLGALTTDPESGAMIDLTDTRVLAGIVLAGPGYGSDDLLPEIRHLHRYLTVDWSTMKPPALVVAGDLDDSPMTLRNWDWHLDPYERSAPGNKCLAVLHGGDHYLGGVQGQGRSVTSDESPERVAYIQRLTLGYLQLVVGGTSAPTPADLVAHETVEIFCR